MGTLKDKAKKGLVWSGIDKLFALTIQFVIGIILARILSPEDYGLIGMIAVFIAISQSLVDSGFFTALVQKRDVSNIDYSTIFYFNIFVGVLLYTILFISSGWIGDFYNTPLLSNITKIIGINILIVSTTIVQKAFLTTNINFRKLAIINISSVIISGSVGIYLALSGYGVWALVFQSIGKNLTMAILYWTLNHWRPELIFNKESFRSLFKFGSKLMVSGLLISFFNNLYLIIIGKVYKAEELGYFTRATFFKQVPATLVSTILQSVSFPVLVKVIDDDDKVRTLLKRSVKLIGFTLSPIIAVLLFFSKPLILLLLTSKWLSTVVLLQILSLEIIFYPLQYINLNFFNAKGRSDLFLRLELIKNVLTVLTILITYGYGLQWISIGYVMVSATSFFLNTYYTNKYVGYSALKQIRDLLPYIISGGVSCLLGFLVCTLFESHLSQLLIGVTISLILYYSISKMLKFRELKEIEDLVLHKIKTK